MRLKKRFASVALSMAMIITMLSGTNISNTNAAVDEVLTIETQAAESSTTDISTADAVDIDVDSDQYSSVDHEKLFTQLFDINNKVEINVSMNSTQLSLLQSDFEKNYKSPIYRKANLYITITDNKAGTKYRYILKEVGVKMKGNTSRTSFYNTSRGIYNNIHLKIDFQETFTDENYYDSTQLHDWSTDSAGKKARKNRTFAGLEKLELKWNRNNDQTYIKDYYTNELYRQNGLLAAHTNLAAVTMGGQTMGVYTIYEPIDKVFINKYLPEEDQGGDLYKCGWVGTTQGSDFTKKVTMGVEDEDKGLFYCYDKKTNKKEVDGVVDHTALNNLISTLNDKTVTKSTLASVVDMDYFVKYAAVAYFAGNPDDMRNNYNNYYVYFLKSNNKAIFITYDNDRTFGVTKDWDPSGKGMTNVSPYSATAIGNGTAQSNPIYKYSVCKGGYYINEYNKALEAVYSNSYFSTTKFNSLFTIAKGNYSNNVTPSKTLDSVNGYTLTFNNTVSSKTSTACKNLSFSDYLTAIKESYVTYKATGGADAYYVVGSMNNWDTSSGNIMTKQSDGTYKITLYWLKGAKYEFKVVMNAPEEGWATSWGNTDGGNAVNSQGASWDYENLTIVFNPKTGKITSTAVKRECPKSETGTHTYTVTQKKATLTADGYYRKKCKYCGHYAENTTVYKASNVKLTTANYVFNNSNQTIKYVVKDSKGKTISSSYYTVSYPSGRKGYGKRSVVITFKGRYSGTKTLYFVIRPAKSSITKYVRGSKRITVTWKKPQYSVSGYQLQYSTTSTFTSGTYKTITIAGNSTVTRRVSNLLGNKRYYFRIRTYKTLSNGTKVYSLWSGISSTVTLN